MFLSFARARMSADETPSGLAGPSAVALFRSSHPTQRPPWWACSRALAIGSMHRRARRAEAKFDSLPVDCTHPPPPFDSIFKGFAWRGYLRFCVRDLEIKPSTLDGIQE
jgi:hypothetical protein